MSSTVNIVHVPSFRDYRAARRRQLRNAVSQYWKRVRARYELSAPVAANLNDIGLVRVVVRQTSRSLRRR